MAAKKKVSQKRAVARKAMRKKVKDLVGDMSDVLKPKPKSPKKPNPAPKKKATKKGVSYGG